MLKTRTTYRPRKPALAGRRGYCRCGGTVAKANDSPDPAGDTNPGTGGNFYTINEKDGTITQEGTTDGTKSEGKDVFTIIGKDGHPKDEFIAIDAGTIEELDSWEVEYPDIKGEAHKHNAFSIQIMGDEASQLLFEFLAENTKVEWGLTLCGRKGICEKNYLSTSFDPFVSGGFKALYNNKLKNGYSIRENWHSHPNGSMISGSPWESGGDFGVAGWFHNQGMQIKLRLYRPGIGYQVYNHEGFNVLLINHQG